MKWSNVVVSVSVFSIHTRPVVAETAERCRWNPLSNACTSKEMLAVSQQAQECHKPKDQTACASQSDCVWASAISGPPRCTSPYIANQTSESSKTANCRKHSKESCGKNTGCEWYSLMGPASCMSLGSIATLNSAGYQKATFFCSPTSKSVCTNEGRECKTVKISMTKEVCEGRLISPWLANACYAHNYAMMTCVKKSPDTSACGKINADLLCFQAHPCYEIKVPVSEGMTSISMKTDCEKGAKLECSSECSMPGAKVVTPSMQKAGATASNANQAHGVGASGVLLVAVLAMRLIF